jgi:lipopolysaccharide export system protein LptA
MRRSDANRYARWAAGIAVLLTCVVAGVYVYRDLEARRLARKAPPIVPETIQTRSSTFSFSKVEGERTLFTVRASRATEFKEGGKAQLEDVWITMYGRSGQRYDNIHTRECDYVASTGRITCAGEVQMDLESAEEARERPGQRALHVGTVNVSFDRETGVARTDNPVVFRFPYGYGRGTGATYSSSDAVFRMHRDIELTLTSKKMGEKAEHPVELRGAALEYHRDSRTLRLAGPVRVRQGERVLDAGEVTLEFDSQLRARTLVAGRKPQMRSLEPQGEFTLAAEELVTHFHSGGWAERILARGNVRGSLKESTSEEKLRAETVQLELEPRRNLPVEVTARGNVVLEFAESGAARQLSTEALRITFAPGSRARERRIAAGETLAAGLLTLRSGDESTIVQAQKFTARFDQRNTLRALDGAGGVSIERWSLGRQPQVTQSHELAIQFGAQGEWSRMQFSGGVRFRESDREAQAERAVLDRSADTLLLTGRAFVSDAVSRTSAATLSFEQRSGEIRATGGVRTSYFAAERDGITNLSAQPAHISADLLQANRSTGRALYSGRARLWQGNAVIESDSIELNRADRQLKASGKVNALLPEDEKSGNGRSGKFILWRIRAGRLIYLSAEGKAVLEEHVSAISPRGEIASKSLELFLADRGDGQRSLARATATGGVTVLARSGPDERRGNAERAEYMASEGKFTLSGGNPILFDNVLGSTSGRQLTFFLADDKILVESEAGSRTLSRHRVEK